MRGFDYAFIIMQFIIVQGWQPGLKLLLISHQHTINCNQLRTTAYKHTCEYTAGVRMPSRAMQNVTRPLGRNTHYA